ncbi:hypothetical protein SASPL_117192 [Salvia splendens]|uniref:Uncharacterized protein n=1 Tax=Salvia splendens TaxID=180675 RepID=A0A8X8ZXX4_SALSN|nr:uncharacterized protein LOC121806547 [Salvia splendens]KAG6420656.1 hypothetical protein SASPL_117192 [Salvia splendens]
MAAPPVKSQPLHNFSLPHLKWAHKNSSTPHNHRFRRRDSADHHPDSDPKQPQPPPPPRDDAAAAEEAKPWKLRPRKEAIKAASSSKKENANNDGSSNGMKSQRLREGAHQSGGVERNAKRKVWISLSREEIEEDVYALTGGKPARRPKKWPKNVQKQLEGVFPGLYLVGVAADSYRVMMS